jgi:hypothetical protein
MKRALLILAGVALLLAISALVGYGLFAGMSSWG